MSERLKKAHNETYNLPWTRCTLDTWYSTTVLGRILYLYTKYHPTGEQRSDLPHPQVPAASATGSSFGPSPPSMSATAMMPVSLWEFTWQCMATWPPYRSVRNRTTAKLAATTKNHTSSNSNGRGGDETKKGIASRGVSYRDTWTTAYPGHRYTVFTCWGATTMQS